MRALRYRLKRASDGGAKIKMKGRGKGKKDRRAG